jgi:hypothetical protein
LIAYVGSSNLTGDGLGTEGEFNLRLRAKRQDQALRHIAETFDRVWRKDSVPLTAQIAENFAPISSRSKQNTAAIDPQIRKVLRPVVRVRRTTPKKLNGAVRCFTFFDQFASASTKTEVRHKTEWNSRGWDWIVFSSRADRDRLVDAESFFLAELHRSGGKLSLNDVQDNDEFGTDDGRFFVAYKKRRNSKAKTLNSRTLKALREHGVIHRKDDLRRNRSLGRAASSVLTKLLNLT